MDESKLIPVPPGHRWREFKIKQLPLLMFCAGVMAVTFIWKDHISAPTFMGEVETVRANVISTVPGLLLEMNVDRFDKVAKDQVIGKVLPADPELLKASLATIEIELKTLQTRVALDDDRNKLNYEQLRLAWLSQRVEVATAKVNLQYAESELVRQTTLHVEKIVSQSEFELAKNLRDARQEEVTEKSKVVLEMEMRLQDLRTLETSHNSGGTNSSLTQAIAAQEARLLLTEGPITIRSPIDGVVSSVNHHSGEKIMAGLPIVTITSQQTSRIVAFARQPLQLIPKVGDRVEVRTRSLPRKMSIANVLQVGSAVEMMMTSASKNKTDITGMLGNPLEQGLPFSVNMPEGLKVYPGETVDLVILR